MRGFDHYGMAIIDNGWQVPFRPTQSEKGSAMRSILGILSVLIVLAVVGMLAKKQLGTVTTAPGLAPADSGVLMPTTTPGASPQQQSEQIQQQVKQSLEAAMQQARPMPDDK